MGDAEVAVENKQYHYVPAVDVLMMFEAPLVDKHQTFSPYRVAPKRSNVKSDRSLRQPHHKASAIFALHTS